ncbi:mitochondrial thioredoxin [Coemansia sp. RSA 2131]|nr:mitochondrial thioredoxin [Coemansia sp. RSA 2131]
MGEDTVHEFKDVQSFNNFITKNEFVVISFSAIWCGPIEAISPVFTSLSEEYPEIKFVKIDIDELEELSQTYGVTTMPTFKFLRCSGVIDECLGANPDELTSKVKAFSEQAKANE